MLDACMRLSPDVVARAVRDAGAAVRHSGADGPEAARAASRAGFPAAAGATAGRPAAGPAV